MISIDILSKSLCAEMLRRSSLTWNTSMQRRCSSHTSHTVRNISQLPRAASFRKQGLETTIAIKPIQSRYSYLGFRNISQLPRSASIRKQILEPSVALQPYLSKCRTCLQCQKAHYTECSSNGSSHSSITYEKIEHLFDESNMEGIKKRLQLVKPVTRPTTSSEKPRRAAVLVPLCRVNGEMSLLFMIRSLRLKNHAGEISFPGGMEDEGDESLVDTALRETREEIGLDTSPVEIIGLTSPIPSRVSIKRGHMVTPVLGYCGNINLEDLTLNKDEVDSVFTRPLSSFLESGNQRQTQFRHPGTKGFTLPVFTGGEYSIWGLTAIITHQILAVLAPELYKFKLNHRR